MNKQKRNFLGKMLIAGTALVGATIPTMARGKRSVKMTEAQKDELFYIYQEEKVARDVYITLGKVYPNENTFASIQLSEQRHIDSAQGLCEKYNVDISGVDEDSIGNFEVPVLQDLYDTCIEMGNESLLDALRVGELIEITDIKDLEHAMIGMPNDVVNIFSNLREGSYNHLEAFQSAITRETSSISTTSTTGARRKGR